MGVTGTDRLVEIMRATREGGPAAPRDVVPRGTPLRPLPVEAVLDVRPSRCLVPGCEGDPRARSAARGLCKAHHMTALRLVRQGSTTWDELEGRGRVLPSRNPRDRRGPAARWLLGLDDESPADARLASLPPRPVRLPPSADTEEGAPDDAIPGGFCPHEHPGNCPECAEARAADRRSYRDEAADREGD